MCHGLAWLLEANPDRRMTMTEAKSLLEGYSHRNNWNPSTPTSNWNPSTPTSQCSSSRMANRGTRRNIARICLPTMPNEKHDTPATTNSPSASEGLNSSPSPSPLPSPARSPLSLPRTPISTPKPGANHLVVGQQICYYARHGKCYLGSISHRLPGKWLLSLDARDSEGRCPMSKAVPNSEAWRITPAGTDSHLLSPEKLAASIQELGNQLNASVVAPVR